MIPLTSCLSGPVWFLLIALEYIAPMIENAAGNVLLFIVLRVSIENNKKEIYTENKYTLELKIS